MLILRPLEFGDSSYPIGKIIDLRGNLILKEKTYNRIVWGFFN
jgi:hypothetical protein